MPIKISQQFDAGAIEVLRADDPAAIDLNIRKDSHADITQWFYFRVQGAQATPLALRFVDSLRGGRHDAPLFIGDTTLVASIWTTLCADGVQAQVRFGEPQPPRGRDRRTWSSDLRVAVQHLLGSDTTD